MAPTTRRQSRLLELGQLPGPQEKDRQDKVDGEKSSAGEVAKKEDEDINEENRIIVATATDHASPTTNTSITSGENEDKQKDLQDTFDATTPTLKECTQSMEMTDIMHIISHHSAKEEPLKSDEEQTSLHRSSSIVTITDNNSNDVQDADSPDSPGSESSSASESDDLEAAFTAELEIEEDPPTGRKPPSTSTLGQPALPLEPSQSSTTNIITTHPPEIAKPNVQTGMVYVATQSKPWEFVYQCFKCEANVRIRGGGQVRDVLRCRDCGYRILVKKRTKRMVQFEAR